MPQHDTQGHGTHRWDLSSHSYLTLFSIAMCSVVVGRPRFALCGDMETFDRNGGAFTVMVRQLFFGSNGSVLSVISLVA
jgi:hypothetical protein